MSNYIVENRLTGEVAHAYASDAPDHADDPYIIAALATLEQVGLIAAGRAAEILA